jgi:hypothetical protein
LQVVRVNGARVIFFLNFWVQPGTTSLIKRNCVSSESLSTLSAEITHGACSLTVLPLLTLSIDGAKWPFGVPSFNASFGAPEYVSKQIF